MKIPKRLRRDPGKEPRVGTYNIQAKIFRGKKVKQLIFREFSNIKMAQEYFKALTTKDGDEIADISENGHVTELVSGIMISTNYSIEKILKGKPPRQKLHIIVDPRDLRKQRIESAKMPEVKPTAKTDRKRKISSGQTVPIKQLCKDLGIDPRKARQKLRKAAKDGIIPHIEKGRWDFDQKDIKLVTKVLVGKK
jgi:hypothetical protein